MAEKLHVVPRGNALAKGPRVPVPESALEQLRRSDAELVAAALADGPGERFVHAHLAALRAGAALVPTPRPGGRRRPRTVWELVADSAPELSAWTTFFADGAATRAAVEAGRDHLVDADRADRAVAAAEDFQDAVRASLGIARDDGGPGLVPWAS